MRIAVVGASGNVGTALLAALRQDPGVGSVVAVARRVPSGPVPAPYDQAEWVGCDVGAVGDDVPVVDRLARAFDGCAAVVHLAWQIQPSHDRDRLRRTNVDGTRRVVAAVRQAGVPHLVAASSVGVYSPAYDDVPRAEGWATDGVRSSGYSVDKVAQERLLDEAEVREPGLTVARLRPALVFQRAAGSAIERYFLGPVAPAAVLRHQLPVLPWPHGFRLQVVHASDLAEAYRAAVLGGHGGAFNIAAPQVLRGPDVAGAVSGGRMVEIPPGLARAGVWAGWLAHGVALSPGWIDLAAGIPLLDTGRAVDVLGWRPRWSAEETLADLIGGLADGAGTASPPLRERRRARPSLLGGQASPN